jgi:ParB family chromosome partitioning protein
MTRKALGRGLGALLSADTTTIDRDSSQEIAAELIDPSPMQPRSYFDERRLAELAQSIAANGIVQPLLVRRRGVRFELVAGERRWRAAQQAGLQRVPVVVRDVPDDKLLELALIENIQREELNPIEEAQAYEKLIGTIGLTQESLASRVGRDRSYITNYLRLLRLPKDIQQLVQEGRLSAGHGRALLGTADVDLQRRVARKIIERELSVRETERAVRQLTERGAVSSPKAGAAKSIDANVRAADGKLRRRLGTQVRIVQSKGTAGGRIEIEFYSSQDLDRIYQLLVPKAESASGSAV